MKRGFLNIVSLLFLLVVMFSGISADAATRVFPGEEKAVYKRITYFYKDVKGSSNAVVLTGIIVPNGITELIVPEKLGDKEVIYIKINEDYDSYFDDTDERPDADDIRYNAPNAIKKIVLSSHIRPDDKNIDLWYFKNLESIEVDLSNKYLKAKNGVLYDIGMKIMYFYPLNKKTKKYKMPSSVENAYALRNDNLEKISFSKNKKFTKCFGYECKKLKSVYFPDNIKHVDGFYKCPQLTAIRWSKNTETIGGFPDCRKLLKLKLPKGLREIEAGAFANCKKLKKISALPKTLRVIGEGAFEKAPCRKKMKRPSYLMCLEDSKIKDKIQINTNDNPVCLAVVDAVKGGKHSYYDSRDIIGLKPSVKRLTLGKGKTKTMDITPGIQLTGYKNGWKMKKDILKFISSNPKIASVSSGGKVKGIKKGTAVITVRMRTSNVKCKIKVTVK